MSNAAYRDDVPFGAPEDWRRIAASNGWQYRLRDGIDVELFPCGEMSLYINSGNDDADELVADGAVFLTRCWLDKNAHAHWCGGGRQLMGTGATPQAALLDLAEDVKAWAKKASVDSKAGREP